MNLNKTLTINDLIIAFVEYEKYRNFDNGDNEITNYYKKKLEIMKELFGYDEADFHERFEILTQNVHERNSPDSKKYYQYDADSMLIMFKNCINLLCRDQSPFINWLAGSPPEIEVRLFEKYDKDLNQAIKTLEEIYTNMAREILKYMFPSIDTKQFEKTNLFEKGLPEEEPDEFDYWLYNDDDD